MKKLLKRIYHNPILTCSSRYRRLALKYHPQKNKTDIAANTFKFTQIAEAYEVLSDPAKKAIFDQFGEIVLKEGLPGKEGKKRCYKYAGNALEIFEKFFGTDNPYFDIVDGILISELTQVVTGSAFEGSLYGSAYGGAGQKPLRAPDDLTVTCECTLEEMYIGCMKKLSYERLALGIDGKSTKKMPETLEIEIKPGYSQETIIKLAGKGNEAYSYPTCNSNSLNIE